MKFLKNLIGNQDHFLLKAKRFLFREFVQSAEKGMEMQYLSSSLRSLREEFDQLQRQDQVTRQKVDEMFQRRKESIQSLWNTFMDHHRNDPGRVERLREGQANIIRRLESAHTEFLQQINTRPPREIQEHHREQYRSFRDRTGRRQAPEGTNTPVPEGPITNPEELFRGRPSRSRETAVNPERQQVSIDFITMARQWQREISPAFSIAFANKILSQPRSIAFLKQALQHPDQLKQFVLSLYQSYRRTQRTESSRSIRQFFERIEPTLQGENVRTAMNQLLETFQQEQVQTEWSRLVEQQTETLSEQVVDGMLNRLEQSMIHNELPNPADLIQLQKINQYVEREFLNGEALRWESIQSSRINPGRYAVPVEYQTSRLPDSTPTGRVLQESTILLQGKSFEISRIEDVRNPLQNLSRTVTRVNGLEKRFDLPHFVMVLKKLHEMYPETEGRTVNFSRLHGEISQHATALRERLHTQRYRELLNSLQFTNSARFENFPQALASFLDQVNLQDPKTGSEWLEQIENLQGNERMNDDNYKFLWMVRFLARTRNVSPDKSSTISEFADELLKATDYRDLRSAPDQMTFEVARDFEDLGSTPASVRGERLRFEYRPDTGNLPLYQQRLPLIRDIFVFTERDLPLSNRRYPSISQTMSALPWAEAVTQLEQAERIGYVSEEGDVVISDRGRTVSAFLFNKETVEAYSQLKQHNPLFRELISLGMAGKSYGLTLSELVHFVLTPNSTRDSVDQVRGGRR